MTEEEELSMVANKKEEEDADSKIVPVFQVYKRRWGVLLLYCLLTGANALLWVTFAPISDLAVIYFGAYGNNSNVNLLAVIFLVLFTPATMLQAYTSKAYGLRFTLLLGGVLTAGGALLRLIVAYSINTCSSECLYAIMLLGQALAALAQPLFVNVAAHVAAIWFAPAERDLATTLGSMFSPIGNAVGSLLPIVFVAKVTDANTGVVSVQGMDVLMLVEFVICAITLLVAFFVLKDAPPTPPSLTSSFKLQQQQPPPPTSSSSPSPSSHSSSSSSSSSRLQFELYSLLHNRDYVILWSSVSLGVAIFNTLLTIVNQFLNPYGYSNDDAGTASAVLIIAGLIGAGLNSKLLEKTKAKRTIIRAGFFMCLLAMILLCCARSYPDNNALLIFSFALLGFFLLPMLPTALENASEVCYPDASEDLSTGTYDMKGTYKYSHQHHALCVI